MKTNILTIMSFLFVVFSFGQVFITPENLARFDTNRDGQLDNAERAAAIPILQAENKVKDAQRIGKAVSSPATTNTPEKKFDSPKAAPVEVLEAEAVADKFLAFVERKNARAAERMSYKIKNGNSNGGRSFRYKVSEFFIQHEINKYKVYGAFLRRTLVSYSVGKTAPSLPDSQYVSLRYKLEFSEKSEEFITIVIKTDGDQAGAVVAYPFGAIYADK